MGTADLHGVLKSLCFNTDWKYAVFWKLKHRARMVLTWEDGYYDNCEQNDTLQNKYSRETLENLHYTHDPLGLAVAKMSYHVYSLGEGIVGEVAVTGKHRWIFADQHVTNSCSSFGLCDGWQSQFSAGIRTVVVVAVVPHGVVQLGSSKKYILSIQVLSMYCEMLRQNQMRQNYKVIEDRELVTRIRNVFFALNDFSVGRVSNPVQCSTKSTLSLPHLPTKSLDEVVYKGGPNVPLPMFPYNEEHSDSLYVYPMAGIQPKMVAEMVNKHVGVQLSMPGSDGHAKLLQPRSNVINLQHHHQMEMDLIGDGLNGGDTSGWKDLDVVEHNATPFSINSVMDSINLCSGALQAEKFIVDPAYFPSNLLDSAIGDKVKLECMDSYQNAALHIPESSDVKLQRDLEKLGDQSKLKHLDPSDKSLKFSADSELHEALGPAFLEKSIYKDGKAENTEVAETIEIPEAMSSSHLTFDPGPENLLEAVVANVCHSGSDVKSERSFCKSVQSLLTSENMPEPFSQTKHAINSVGYSMNQPSLVKEDTQQCLNSSEVCGAVSSKGFSSTCPSACSEQLDRSSEPSKSNKKRARPGENSRPRPRDRQLIQDRIKELRELVPNGSKCSIDSLLERSIKHMLFLQSITKHADKLSKCAESKMHQKGTGIQGSSNYEQGSSWAVEVGSHLKVCSIIVENLNKSGQMLVEMLCEECSHFLEIAEAIRSLGLTILKGVTEAHGEKTWICFVVEGQDNRIMHRMDVLWSLVQIFQSKTSCSS